jgi:hypothetical protein
MTNQLSSLLPHHTSSLDEIAIQVTERMLNNQPFRTINNDLCFNSMLYMAISKNEIPQNLVIKAQAMRAALTNFLNDYDKSLAKLIKTYEACFQFQQAQKAKLENLPQFASKEDSDEVIDFIRSLNRDYYTFKEAGNLTGYARQTLKRWAEEERFGIKCEVVLGKKRDYLSRESLVKIFRKSRSKNFQV